MADLPIKELGDEAPLYDRPHIANTFQPAIKPETSTPPMGNGEALLRLVGSPDLCSKRWVWEQYDHLILGNTVQTPGGDAAIVRIEDGPKGLALTTDVTPRYCEADPVEGGKQAVAEAWRNITAVGGRPLALTDNLNFGNPEKPEVMGQLVGAIRGIGEACRALDFPVVSGNVSLYNETQGRSILPTPTIGGVGVVDDVAAHATLAFKRAGETIFLIGETRGLARPVALPSRYLRPRRRSAAAGRPRGGAAQRRFRARPHHGRRVTPCMTARTAGWRWRWPRWQSPAGSGPASNGCRKTCRRMPFCSARIRAATWWPRPAMPSQPLPPTRRPPAYRSHAWGQQAETR